MPFNNEFMFDVIVANTKLHEYQVDSEYYIETNLGTPCSYKQQITEIVSGEPEQQEVPVTPYQIRVKANKDNKVERHYYRVLVDGVKVKGTSLRPGEEKLINGFKDGAKIREFLFSMPRFATDETDRVNEENVSKIGKIEVECWRATLRSCRWVNKKRRLKFTQANKKDSSRVTGGNYTLVTSKAGKYIKAREEMRLVDHWKKDDVISKLTVHYRMGHTLREMGVQLLPPQWSNPDTGVINRVKSEIKKEPVKREIERDTEEVKTRIRNKKPRVSPRHTETETHRHNNNITCDQDDIIIIDDDSNDCKLINKSKNSPKGQNLFNITKTSNGNQEKLSHTIVSDKRQQESQGQYTAHDDSNDTDFVEVIENQEVHDKDRICSSSPVHSSPGTLGCSIVDNIVINKDKEDNSSSVLLNSNTSNNSELESITEQVNTGTISQQIYRETTALDEDSIQDSGISSNFEDSLNNQLVLKVKKERALDLNMNNSEIEDYGSEVEIVDTVSPYRRKVIDVITLEND